MGCSSSKPKSGTSAGAADVPTRVPQAGGDAATDAAMDAAASELQGAAAGYLAAKKKKAEEDAAAAELQGAAAGYLAAKRAKAAAEGGGADPPAPAEMGIAQSVGNFFSNVGEAFSQRFAPAPEPTPDAPAADVKV